MASKKKEASGISLLSMYNDEDEEIEDADSEEHDADNDESKFDNVDSAMGDVQPEQEENVKNFTNKEGAFESDHTPEQLQSAMNSEQHNSQKVSLSKDEAVSESHGAEGKVDKSDAEASKDVDPLDLFLPQPPVGKCSLELQEKINKFLALKKLGKSFNKEVRNKKAYRNPDFLLHAVTYQDIDQIGSCFSKDVFDPHGYDKSDYYDEIVADMKREWDLEQERKKNHKVDIVGGVQPGSVTAAMRPTLPSPVSNLAVGGPSASDAVPREGRQSKKSKWDKI